MTTTKNALNKLAAARVFIKSQPLKKEGVNDFSKYNYFTPEQVAKLVNDACIETNSICVFSLLKDELGYYGEVVFADMESGESLVTVMRTEKPSIKATNETQQMGGMQTYTKRYALMSLFDIEDNTMDFDNPESLKNNAKQQPQQNTQQPQGNNELPWLNEDTKEYNGAIKKLKEGTTTIEKISKAFRLNKIIMAKLKEAEKNA